MHHCTVRHFECDVKKKSNIILAVGEQDKGYTWGNPPSHTYAPRPFPSLPPPPLPPTPAPPFRFALGKSRAGASESHVQSRGGRGAGPHVLLDSFAGRRSCSPSFIKTTRRVREPSSKLELQLTSSYIVALPSRGGATTDRCFLHNSAVLC